MGYDSYEDVYDDAYEDAMEDVISDTRELVEDDNVVSINLKKDLFEGMFREVLFKQCEDIKNTIKTSIIENVKKELIEDEFNEILKEELRNSIREQTDKMMLNFMDKEIVVAKGYYDTETTTCKKMIEYNISDFLNNKLEKKLKDTIRNIVDYDTQATIEKFSRDLKKEVSNKISDMFNQTTKNVLSDQLFNILTQNETYQNLASNINGLLENK